MTNINYELVLQKWNGSEFEEVKTITAGTYDECNRECRTQDVKENEFLEIIEIKGEEINNSWICQTGSGIEKIAEDNDLNIEF